MRNTYWEESVSPIIQTYLIKILYILSNIYLFTYYYSEIRSVTRG